MLLRCSLVVFVSLTAVVLASLPLYAADPDPLGSILVVRSGPPAATLSGSPALLPQEEYPTPPPKPPGNMVSVGLYTTTLSEPDPEYKDSAVDFAYERVLRQDGKRVHSLGFLYAFARDSQLDPYFGYTPVTLTTRTNWLTYNVRTGSTGSGFYFGSGAGLCFAKAVAEVYGYPVSWSKTKFGYRLFAGYRMGGKPASLRLELEYRDAGDIEDIKLKGFSIGVGASF